MLLANSASSLTNEADLACKLSDFAERFIVSFGETSVHADDRRTIASFASAIAEFASELASFVSELAANASV